jgi:hypothetical protein
MRIGVRVTVDEVSAVAIHEDGRFARARQRARGDDLTAVVAAVLKRLHHNVAEEVSSVVFDVSGVLAPDRATGIVSVLIEPRHPLEPRQHLWLTHGIPVETVHILGGHDALGHELVALDEEALRLLAARTPSGSHVVISAAGSQVNPNHERRAGEALRSAADVDSITGSSSFYSDSLLVREFTAVLNTSLLRSAEQVAATLADAVAQGAGERVRSFVTTNEGGCTPLSRLPITPVHSMRAEIAGAMLGGAAVAGRSEGRIIVARAGDVRIADFIDGLPSVISRGTVPGGVSIASSFAHVVPLTSLLLSGSAEPPVTILVEGAERELDAFGLAPAIVTAEDLVAVGAAVAPMSYWHNRVVHVLGADDINRALAAGEAAARANLVAWGAPPAGVRISESRVLATTYGAAQMIRVRVRGVAETNVSGVPAEHNFERSGA